MNTPPLLAKMIEVQVGEIVVRGNRIVEPATGCRIAGGFPSRDAAIRAATAMNEIADWPGVIKTRAENGRPNCLPELERIAKEHGGVIGDGGGAASARRCAAVVAKRQL